MGKKHRNKYKPKSNNRKRVTSKHSHTITDVQHIKIKIQPKTFDVNKVKHCYYFRNKICIYFNDFCNPYSIKCKSPDILLTQSNDKANKQLNDTKNQKITTHNNHPIYAKSVVLQHNKKCVLENHTMSDVVVKIKLLLKNNNNIIDISIPAGYCKQCNQYIILKSDYGNIKKKGILLCKVIDQTPEYLNKKHKSYYGTESKLHRLGYNVIKQGYNYTSQQRRIILANIMENYHVSKHEILSMLDTNISRKIGLLNYVDAVFKWKEDREFVSTYKLGDIPEVIIDKIVIGKRK